MAARCILQLGRTTRHLTVVLTCCRSLVSVSIPEALQRRPKRPLNAYFIFSQEHMSHLQQENFDLSITELTKLMAERYRQLDESTREKYARHAQEASEKWKQNMQYYAQALTDDEKLQIQRYYEAKQEEAQKRQKRLEARARRANMPARHLSAYSFFVKDFISIHKSTYSQPRETIRAAAQQWNQMSEEEKEPYIDSSAEDKIRYDNEMAQYESEKPAKPPRRPPTSFALFVKEKMSSVQGSSIQQVAEQWRNMTDEEKKGYKDMAAGLREQYEMEKVGNDEKRSS